MMPLSPTLPRNAPLTAAQTVLIAVAAAVWLWPGVNLALGLHGDEAFVGLAADALNRGGGLGTRGMNTHTGPVHQWLVAALFRACGGPSVLALRSVGVVCNGVAAALYARALAVVLGRAEAMWSTALLLTLPSIATFSHVAVEHFAVNPLIMMAALTVALGSPNSRHAQLGAGMLLGLGTWTHLIFLAVPAAWAAVALWHFGRSIVRRADVRRVALGWAIVYAVPFVRMCTRIKIRHGGLGLLTRLAQTPKLLWLTWHGHYAALRTVGVEVAGMGFNTWARATIVACALYGLWQLGRRGAGAKPLQRLLFAAVVAFGAMLVTTATIAPFCADRFVLLPLYFLPVAVVVGLGAWTQTRGTLSWAQHAACACLLVLQLQYFYGAIGRPYRAGAVTGNVFALFGVPETNNHYIDTLPVYRALEAMQAREVLAQNFIGWALRFYDIQAGRLHVRLTDDDDSFEPRACPHPRDVLVVYARGYRNDHIDTAATTNFLGALQHFTLLRSKQVVPEG